EGAVVVGISQSGASPDVASVLAEARRQGRPTVALTNAPDSPLAREADAVLLLEAGDERAVAATKTYLNSLGAIAMLFAAADGPVAEAELARMPSVEGLVFPLLERGARIIAVSDVTAVLRRARTKLPLVARVPEWLSAMTAVIPGQLTALRLAQLRGLDIDSPAGLNKVTLTR